MKYLVLFAFLTFGSVVAGFGQEIYDQKEAERLYRESIKQGKLNKLYFDEYRKCRALMNEGEYIKAEASCRVAVRHSENLPKESYMERSNALASVGQALLRQRNGINAINYFEKALEVARPVLNGAEPDAGEIYFLIGQAYHVNKDVSKAREFYNKAEKTFRDAFVEINEETLRSRYPKVIKYIIESHLILLKEANLNEDFQKLTLRLAETEKEFAEYL